MLHRNLPSRLRAWLAVLLLSLLMMPAVSNAQDEGGQVLVPGLSLDAEISEDERAQIFTYEGSAGENVKLTLISADGLALGVLVADANGETLSQATDETGNGFLVLDNVEIAADGTYYVVVFPLAVEDLPTLGQFSLSLALNTLAVAQAETNDEATEAVTEEAEATPEATAEATEEAAATPEAPVVTEEAIPATAPPVTVVDVTPGEVLTTAGIQVSLTWNATADFNLEVRDPVGGSVFWNNPTVESGGTFTSANINGACETFTADSPTETLSWAPGSVPSGSYEVLVHYVLDCEVNGAVPFTLDIVVDGEPLAPVQGTLLPNQDFLTSFVIDPEGNVTQRSGGVQQAALPAQVAEITANAEPIVREQPVNGVVANAQPYQAYTFDATGGEVINAALQATSGSLDTFLFLLDPNGQVLISNDDDGESTNSAVNAQLLSETGTYTLVATRYGQLIGGTEGEFTLTLSSADAGSSVPEALLGIELPAGIIEVSLVWQTDADLQLLVRDPAGDAVFDDEPIIVSGGRLEAAGNVGCTATQETPLSYIYWPEGQRVRPGTYEIDVWFQNTCNDNTPVEATLTVGIAGNTIISETFRPLPDEHFITTFTIGTDGSVVAGRSGIAGGSETITAGPLADDYNAKLSVAPGLTLGVPVTGDISDANRFDVYTFEANAGDVVNLSMQATAGTLDTLVYLLSPTGIELTFSDDINAPENTNSLISEYTLPSTGTYTVIATHYGTIFGGTNGVYTLTLSGN